MTKWVWLRAKKLLEDVTASKYLGDPFNGLLINRAVAGLSNGVLPGLHLLLGANARHC